MRSYKMFAVTFAASAVLFALMAWGIISIVKPFKSNEDEIPVFNDETQNTGGDIQDEPSEDADIITFLAVGTDYQPDLLKDYQVNVDETSEGFKPVPRKVSADTVLLISINKENATYTFCSLPSNMIVSSATNMMLKETYSDKGIDYMLDCVKALTGYKVDYYGVISLPDFEKTLEKLGRLSYNVPCDMKYSDPWQDLDIDLKKGVQALTPKQVTDMLRYDSFVGDILTRESVTVGFAQTLFKQLTSGTFKSEAVTIFSDLLGKIETNFSVSSFRKHMDLIFSYHEFSPRTVTYPGTSFVRDGVKYFQPDVASAIQLFSETK